MSSGTSVAELPAARAASSSSSSAPTVRATATTCAPPRAKANAVARPMPRDAPVMSAMQSANGWDIYRSVSPLARLGEKRELPWRCVLRAAIGERGRIFPGEAMVGELRTHGIAAFFAHGAVDAVDRKERQGIGADELAHAFEVMRGGEEVILLGRIDAVIVWGGERRGGGARKVRPT